MEADKIVNKCVSEYISYRKKSKRTVPAALVKIQLVIDILEREIKEKSNLISAVLNFTKSFVALSGRTRQKK